VQCHISVVLWLNYLQTSLLFIYRVIHKSLWEVRPLRYSSRNGHNEAEHANRRRDTSSFCPTLQVLDMSFLLCLSCCTAEFDSSGTYELPCTSIFTFITQVKFAYEIFRFEYKLWERHGITGQIYVCGWSYASCLFFSNGPSAIEHTLNWNVRQAWKNLYTTGILSYKDSCSLVHFSSNISCVCPHRLALLWLDEENSHITRHSKNILLLSTASFRLSCDYNAWQSEWGFAPRTITTSYVSLLNESWERNEKALCMAKQQTYEVSKITGRLRNYYSWGAYVHNWVKWLEHVSDYKPLSDVELTSGDIILCLYMSVQTI
jgi:hypothetical protein